MNKAEALSNEITDLWLKSLKKTRKTVVRHTGRKRLFLFVHKNFVERILRDGGVIELKRDRKAKLEAAFLIGSGSCIPDKKMKQPYSCFVAFTRVGDTSALEWVKTNLFQHRARLMQGCDSHLDPWQSSLLPTLKKMGIYPTSITLQGEIEAGLKKLKKHYGNSLMAPLQQNGLRIELGKNKHDVDAYIRVIKSEFTRNPQFGSFVASSFFLNAIRSHILKEFRKGRRPLLVVKRGGKILGGIDHSEIAKDLNGKSRTGFGINLAQEIHGKNIARCLYVAIMENLHKKKVKKFRGGTAQPGVMRLAKIMGRRMDGILVETLKKPLFPPNHFKGWI